MAISVDWGQKIINVPKADTTLVQSTPTEIRQLDLDTFRLTLKDLEDDAQGMPYLDTHRHNTTVTVGGVTLARVIKIINGYTVTFEDGQYAVNLAGANSNVADVTNVNQVSIRSANSAGLQDISGFQERLDYQGAVWLDSINGAPATAIEHPWGTPAQPVDNFSDAAQLCAEYGIYEIRFFAGGVATPITIDVDVSDLNIVPITSGQHIFLATGNVVNGTRFERTYLSGTAGGTDPFYGDFVGFFGGFQNLRGIFTESLLLPDPAGLDNRVFLGDDFSCVNLASGIPGAAPGELCNLLAAADTNIQIIGYTGGLEIHNTQAGDVANIDFRSGYLRLNASVSGGDYAVRGVIAPIDNQGTPDSLDITGLITSEDAEFASYADASVWVSTGSGTAGTLFPVGTSRQPVSNSTDAQTIANAKGLSTIRLTDHLTLDIGPDHTDMLFQGRSPRTTALTIPAGATVTGAEYRNMLLTGPLSGGTYITSVALKGVDNFAGHAERCVVRGDLAAGLSYSMRGNLAGGIIMLNSCSSADAFNVGQPAIIDCNGDAMINARAWSGEMKVVNKTGTKPMSIDMVTGTLELDSTVTGACTIYITGVGTLIDNSGPNVNVVNNLIDGSFQQDMSFGGAVHIDAVNGTSGTRYPQGTMLHPVDNIADALTVAAEHNITHLHAMSDLTIGPAITMTGYTIMGEGMRRTAITVDQDATLEECTITMAYVTGVLDNESSLVNCMAEDLEIRNGELRGCTLMGTITKNTVGGGNTTASIVDCWSGVAGESTPILDMGGAGGTLSMRGYHGGITLRNKTGLESASIDLASGQVILESTVTGGTVVVRGVGKLLDSSVGATVIDELIDGRRLTLIEKITRNRLETDPTAGTLTIYDDDGLTPLVTANIYEDVAATQPYQGQGVDRRERLQ